MKYILVSGNPKDGFNYTGPFPTSETATEYGEDVGKKEFWVVELLQPLTKKERSTTRLTPCNTITTHVAKGIRTLDPASAWPFIRQNPVIGHD